MNDDSLRRIKKRPSKNPSITLQAPDIDQKPIRNVMESNSEVHSSKP